MRPLRTIRAAVLAAIVALPMLPAAPAAAYAPYDTVTRTIQSQGNVGRNSAVALMSNGLPLIASFDSTNHEIDVVACANSDCTSGETHTVSGYMYSASVDIAIAPDGLPVIAGSVGTGVFVIKCGDTICSSVSDTNYVAAAADWGTSFHGVSVAVDSKGHPRVTYSMHGVGIRALHAVSCNDAACAGGDDHNKYLHGSTQGHWSDVVVDDGDRTVIAWSTGAKTFLTRCGGTCASPVTEVIGSGMLDPNVATLGGDVSIVGRTSQNQLRKVECTPQCAEPTAVMALNDRGHQADIAYVGPGHTVIAYREPSRGWLEFIDCQSTCLAPQFADGAPSPSGNGPSIAGGDDYAYVSHATGRWDLGLTHIHRPMKPGKSFGR